MKKVFKGIMIAATVTLSASVAFNAAADTNALDKLLEQVKSQRSSEGRINQQREQEFLSDRADKQALLNTAKRQFTAEENRGKDLAKQYADNDILIAQKQQELESAKGTLGELFGVVRQSANDTIGAIDASIISAQYTGREDLLKSLAEAKELPTIAELEELWIALLTEMTESAKITTFDATVVQLNGDNAQQRVTRFGSFHLTTDSDYLLYSPETKQIQPLGRSPESHMRSAVSAFTKAAPGTLSSIYVDPSKGNTILRLNQQRATIVDQFHQGGPVGYTITAIMILGFIIAAERLFTLGVIGAKMKKQLKNVASPNTNNPLGRILKVYHENKNSDVENLELKLDEAILKETPRIERGINIIKVLAAVSPLVGLLGTVIGMIGTFQVIMLFGTGDPKLMAGNISMALITTAQGLISALPLIFVHSIVSARSKSILHILDEQSAGIIAAHAEKEKA